MRELRDDEWDYGLEPGEPFEPTDEDEDSFDLTAPHVMTVLGPVEPGALGFMLHHEHLICQPPGPEIDQDLVLNDIARAASELEGYFATGGRAIVDITTSDFGRNVDDLRWIARRTPVHIVATTGVRDVWHGSSAQLAEVMIDELLVGIHGAPTRAGVIRATADPVALQAAARAHQATGVPISLPADAESISTLIELGVEPSRLIATTGDASNLRSILESGVALSLIGWNGGESDDAGRAETIAELAGAGFRDRLLISGGTSRRSNWLSYGGGPGFVHYIDRVPLVLMDAGLGALDVRRIFFENPAAALTIQPPVS